MRFLLVSFELDEIMSLSDRIEVIFDGQITGSVPGKDADEKELGFMMAGGKKQMNKKKSILESNVLYTIIAIIAGFLIGAIFLMIAGISPAVAYGKLFSSIFSKPKYLVWTLVYASPLIFTGLSVAFSFRTGVFNIGAEGQFVIGGLVACVLGIVLDASGR